MLQIKLRRFDLQLVPNLTRLQTTLGARLSKLLNIPHIKLDILHWGPNWQACPADEFRAKVQEKLDESAETGWVIDGSYVSKLGNLVKDNATDIICEPTCHPCNGFSSLHYFTRPAGLDPPFILYFPRICYRTFTRLLGYGDPCSPGCDESWRDVFTLGERSILWWCWTHHDPCRRRQQADMMNEELRGKTYRLGGWGRELENWIKDVREMVRSV